MFRDQRQQVFPGIGRTKLLLGRRDGEFIRSAMDGDGLARSSRDLHLRDEGGLLDGNLRILEMVIVQADLADREASWVGCKIRQFSQRFGSGTLRLLRMDACGSEDLW